MTNFEATRQGTSCSMALLSPQQGGGSSATEKQYVYILYTFCAVGQGWVCARAWLGLGCSTVVGRMN